MFNRPPFPFPQSRSEQEKFMRAKNFKFDVMLENENLLKFIWDNKLYDFCNDFNSIEDLKEAISTPEFTEDVAGVLKFKDHKSNVVNTRNGIRITTDQPKKHKRAIFLVGGCTIFGVGADDSHTIASFLQRKMNDLIPNEEFIVYNYGYFVGGFGEHRFEKLLCILSSLPTKKGDIVFLAHFGQILREMPFCNLRFKSERPHNYGEIFLDMRHYSANGNRMIADGLFEFLEQHDFFRNATMKIIRPGIESLPKQNAENNENELLTNYKQELTDFFKKNILPTVGAIVMNANPFTYGHRYLIEEALKECDYLIVFVVEEDKSEIPFNDRFALVKNNVSDLSRVFVLKSGEFIISSKTFSEYFCKESIQEEKIDTTLDVTLFAREIAPCLNITIRFAGKEPTDNITRQYNEDMAKILPQYGIKFVEIERQLTKNGEIISASTVRQLAKAGEFEKIKSFAPPATLEYLRRI